MAGLINSSIYYVVPRIVECRAAAEKIDISAEQAGYALPKKITHQRKF